MFAQFFAWAGSFLGGSFSSVFTSILGSVFQFYSKSQDTKLEEFKTGTGVDVEAYKAFLAYDQSLVLARIAGGNWWGAHFLFLLVGFPVCLHVGMMYLDTTVRFGCGHYGCLGIPDVPPDFRPIRGMVLAYLFGAGAIKSFASIAAPLLKK